MLRFKGHYFFVDTSLKKTKRTFTELVERCRIKGFSLKKHYYDGE